MTEYLTVDEIAKSLRLSKMTAYRLINTGVIPAIRVGRSFRIRRADFIAYLRNAAVPPAGAS